MSEIDKSILLPKDGYIRLLDNDRDGTADVVFIMDYKVIDVNSIDKNKYIIYDKNSLENKLELQNAFDSGTLYISDSNGFEINFEDISAGDVIIAYESKDGETASLELLSNTVSGAVNSYSEAHKEIRIDGVTYSAAAGLNWEDLKLSLLGKFYLDNRGRMVYFREKTKPGTQYGYMTKCVYDSNEEKLYIKILNTDSKIVSLTPAKKLFVDDSVYKNYQKAYTKITSNGKVSQLVRYELNEAGELSKLYTAGGTNNSEGFRITFPRQSRRYISAQRSFLGSYNLSADSLLFRIPSDDATDYDSYGVYRRSYLENAQSYDVEAYNYGEGDLVPDAVVIYEAAHHTRNAYGVVSDCGETITDENEVKCYVTLVQQWETKTYYTDNADLTADVAIGDFVRCSYDVKNKIYGMECLYDYSEDTYLRDSNPSGSYAIGDRLVFGQVYEKQGTVIGVSFDKINGTADRSLLETCETDIFRMYRMNEDLIEPVPVQANIDDIKDYKHFGDDCSKVMVLTNGENPIIMVVY